MLRSGPPTSMRRHPANGLLAALCLFATTYMPAQANILVVVHRSTQVMDVSDRGVLLARWPVSTARPGFVTPPGAYRPTRLERMWRSSKYEWAPMPHSIFFRGGYAIHGTFETRALGRPVSHGCVRLAPGNARYLFDLVRRDGGGQARIIVR
jgi:lipoprotein-anchoring transpeptidase ErfK/SrfK